MILAFLLSACSRDKSGGDTGAPAAPDCPAGSHADGDGCAADLTGWSAGSSLISARDHHVTFAAEAGGQAALFALAGTTSTGRANATAERAWLGEDGSLGEWEALDDLPEGRIGPGFAQVGSGFVAVGGLLSSSDSTAATWVGRVEEDGTLTLADGPELATSRYHVAVAAVGGYVYAIGGMYQQVSGGVTQEVLASVERAAFDGETLGAWEPAGELPEPTTHCAVAVSGDSIYVIGGGDGAAARTTALRAVVGEDGSLSEWELAGELPSGRATAAATVFLDQLYVIAGMESLVGDEVATVLRADVGEDGQLGAFEELPELPAARAHAHQAPLAQGALYSVGGSIEHVPQAEVYVGQLE